MGIGQLVILIVVGFLLQAALDYPSGALGDWIVQRWILFFGFSFQALAFAASFFVDSLSGLLVVHINLNGILLLDIKLFMSEL